MKLHMTPQENLLSAKFDAKYRENSDEELSPPAGLCFSNEGHLLLADDFNHRIQVYDSQNNLLHCLGSKGKEPGQFQYPKGIAVDPDGNIYVADCWNHRIQKFDSKGNHLLSFGTCGDAKGELNEPYDILVEPSGNLIVVERYNHRIQFFDPQGISLGWVGNRGTILEEQLAELQGTPKNILASPLFELPTSIARDSRENYFITDSGNHRVRKFNSQWQEIMSFGEKGSSLGQFEYPLCVTVAPNDLLYVADLNNERVQVFSPFGQYLFAIDEASTGQIFAAPCLTAIDLKGCLHIGFTFSTQVFRYLIPLVSQDTLAENLGALPNPIPTHTFYQALILKQESDDSKAVTVFEKALTLLSENAPEKTSPNLKINVALELSHLSKQGATLNDDTLNLACKLAEGQLKQAREKILQCYLSWQEIALNFNQHLHEEQRQVMTDPDGVRDFNRDLHIAEQEDKKQYRLTRNESYSYRKTIKQFSKFISNSIESGLPEAQLKFLNDVLLGHIRETLNLMKEYFGQKEKSEESMVQLLGESQGEKDKLSAFLTQYYSNERIMDLQQHLQFELQSHWLNLRTLARSTQKHVGLKNFAGKMDGDSSAFEDILKILLGFHENWVAYPQLEQQFLNSLDTLLRKPPYSETKMEKNITLADFTPITYDSENLNFLGILNALKTEGLPLSAENDTLFWGQEKFRFTEFPEHKKELAQCALKLMETQATYQEKSQELLQQLEEILRKRNDLDIQLKQTTVEDKISPIAVNDNIAIVQFQINLIRRMIMSLDINQSLNLHRLVLAGAFLSLNSDENSTAQQFFQVFNDYHIQQDKKVRETSKSRRENTFKLSVLSSQVEELSSKYNISEISDSVRIDEENSQVQIALDRCEFEYQRNSRIKNTLDRLVEFRDLLSHSGNSSKASFRETRILEIANVSIGHTLSPQGICHNQDGDLLVASYENHQVYTYSPEGNYQFHFGGWGCAPEKLQYPNNLAIDSKGSIYVIEEKNQLIKKFDQEGTYLFQFGLGQLGMIFSLSIDSQDNIWAADPEHNRIIIFDPNGAEVRTISGENQSTSLKQPVSVYCLENGEYLVGDKSESLLKHFDQQDNIINRANKAAWEVDEIYFMARHPKHGIYGSDFWNSQIVHFSNKLEVQSVYHKPGKRAGQLGKVGGLSIFNDQLAVANFDGGKVQIFDLSS